MKKTHSKKNNKRVSIPVVKATSTTNPSTPNTQEVPVSTIQAPAKKSFWSRLKSAVSTVASVIASPAIAAAKFVSPPVVAAAKCVGRCFSKLATVLFSFVSKPVKVVGLFVTTQALRAFSFLQGVGYKVAAAVHGLFSSKSAAVSAPEAQSFSFTDDEWAQVMAATIAQDPSSRSFTSNEWAQVREISEALAGCDASF